MMTATHDLACHFVDLPTLRLHYAACGPGDGPPVILLHGFPDFWYSWRFQLAALAGAGFRVIAPDQRGYNLTEKQGPFDMDTLAGDIAHLQDALGYSAAHIVGHDWGGAVAYHFAARHPHRTLRLAVMNAPHYSAYLDTVKRGMTQSLKSWYIYFFQIPGVAEASLRARNFDALRRAFRQLPPENMGVEDSARYIAAWQQPGAITAMLNWYRVAFRATLRSGLSAPPQLVRNPTCVIWGEQDFALDKSCNDTLRRYVPDLKLHYLPDAGHWVQMHRPQQVNQLLLAFLGNPGGRAANSD